MKLKFFLPLMMMTFALIFNACQGDPENGGFADKCYFILQYELTDCGDCCEPGDRLGFDIRFCDENENIYNFPDNIVPGDARLIALPSGHEYYGMILNNGEYNESCSHMDNVRFSVIDPATQEVCFVYDTSVDGRPEVWGCDFGGIHFNLAADCEGCASVNVEPEPECCTQGSIYNSTNDVPQGGFAGNVFLGLSGQDCDLSNVASTCVQLSAGGTLPAFNGLSSGCFYTGLQSSFAYESPLNIPLNIKVTIAFNNGCDDIVLTTMAYPPGLGE